MALRFAWYVSGKTSTGTTVDAGPFPSEDGARGFARQQRLTCVYVFDIEREDAREDRYAREENDLRDMEDWR